MIKGKRWLVGGSEDDGMIKGVTDYSIVSEENRCRKK